MSWNLSTDQSDAIDGICNTLSNSNEQTIAVLTGAAGTGKSTVVTEILNQLPTKNIALCATTHRAATVLCDIVGKPTTTAHALFKLAPSVSKYGKEVLKASGKCNIPDGSIVIIDEASMIGNAFLKAIVDIVNDKKLKLLFVGDPFQLPPPKDKCSLFDGSLPTYTLTQVHRQADGNPILDKATEFREFIEGKIPNEPTLDSLTNSAGEGIHILPHQDFVGEFVKKYMSYKVGAIVDIPLCTFTNESAINYNNMIRKAAYFLEDTIAPFYEGERLIANSIVKQGNSTILTNNESVIVNSFEDAEYNNIKGYYVHVTGNYDEYKRTEKKIVFVPIHKMAADTVLDQLKAEAIAGKEKALWVEFYNVKNYLADLRPPFAGTTHKAQGGTFPAVFIDRVNIAKCKVPATRARLMYVALTRAAKNVYINS